MKLLSLAVLALLAACPKSGDKKPADPAPRKDAGSAQTLAPVDDGGTVVPQLPPAPPVPRTPAGLPALPSTPELASITPEAVVLGELLFHDARLSTTGKLACASCHDPARGYSGQVDQTAAGKANLRRTPTLVNLAWVNAFGWDGRYPTLVALVSAHVPGQLGQTLDAALPALLELPLYKAHFARVGGDAKTAAIQALSAFVLTRYEGDSYWDSVEQTARSPRPGVTPDRIIAGYLVFAGKGQCAGCHPPPLYTDGGFHRVLLDPRGDPGRGFVDKAQTGAFRTPTLRGAMLRPSLFHTGAANSVPAAIAHYAGSVKTPGLDPALPAIALTPDDQTNLAVFLNVLSKLRPVPTKPALP
ncbi:MAG: hypothetical protein H0T42_14580 [Deltaproteobacteria bacterium]|nr:hypothetical protein [Deltaproteobacteria bacterium]